MNDQQLNKFTEILRTELDDVKQLFRAGLSQTEIRLEQKLTEKIDTKVDGLRDELVQRMDNGFAGIAEIIEGQNDRLDDHETRIGALEAA